MKTRIKFIFANGETAYDKNKLTYARAKSWAKSSNRYEEKKGWKIAKVIKVPIKRKPVRRSTSSYNMFGIKPMRF